MSLACTICGESLPHQYPCHTNHPDLCHDCWHTSMAGNTLERQDHLAPETPLTLTPRDVQALVRYRLHRQAVLGTGPCRPLVTEDD